MDALDWQAQLRQGRLLQGSAPGLAAVHFQLALELAPDNPEVRLALGQALLASQDPEGAHEHFLALAQAGGGDVHFWLALAQERIGQPEAAMATLQQLLRQLPQHAPARLQLARLEAAAAQLEFAAASYRRYLQLQPGDLEACAELAEVLERLGQLGEAAELLMVIYRQDPQQTQVLLRWLQLKAFDDPSLMMQLLIQLAREVPSLRSQIAVQMASVMEHASEMEERQRCLEMALEDPLLPDRPAWQLRASLSVPYLPASSNEIQQALNQLDTQLTAYEQRLPDGAEVLPDFSNLYPYLRSWTPFNFLPYLNVDPLPWRRRWGAVFSRMLPPRPVPGPDSPQLRLGFVLNQNSSIRAFLLELLRRWPAGRGQVVVFINPPPAGTVAPEVPVLRPDFEQLLLHANPDEALEQIARARLDLLFLSEVHTDQLLQSLLACYRLAPVQLTSWLSSGSSGLPQIDYFLSSKLLEQAENPERFYSETLLQLEEIPSYFLPPMLLDQAPPRSDYGLPAGRLYLCPHLIYKLHPDYDTILAEILERDPAGQLVLISKPDNRFLRNKLLARFENRFPKLMPRIWFLPKLSHQDYLGLLTLADVMLDPFYFGGGTTSYEALGLGVPIVTWPGERLHGRITYAYYR
ncbi:MAG: tetratricopeptide repeat protein, partial [Candidatus Sericytochromatia bacterium]